MFGTSQSTAILNRAALAQLDNLFSYAMALSPSQAEAEKLVLATYRSAAKALVDLPKDVDLRNYLHAIARSIWVGGMNRAVTEHCPPIFDKEPDAIVEQRPKRAARASGLEGDSMRRALRRLPRPHREVIVLREFEGLSYCEIADIVNCPAGTVWSRLERARQRLRLMLGTRRGIARPVQPEVTSL
jgi:RNA polymerase sigma-70 factor (ECF subfamily)